MDAEQIIPQEDDAFIVDGSRAGRYDVFTDGKHIGTRGDMDAAVGLVVSEMSRTNYYPNVWGLVNDHGNMTLLLVTIDDHVGAFTWDYSDVAYV